jgi:hypothetical protein
MNASKLSMIGNLCTKTNALDTVNGEMGIRGKGGHQQVVFFSTIERGIGGEPQL